MEGAVGARNRRRDPGNTPGSLSHGCRWSGMDTGGDFASGRGGSPARASWAHEAVEDEVQEFLQLLRG